jgi:hypothetical protein
MRSALALTIATLLLLPDALPAGEADAAVAESFAFGVAQAPHPLAADPSLSDPAWSAGLVPDEGPWEDLTTRSAAAHKTAAYVLYDDHNLYVGFRVEQSGIPITATQSTNDIGFGTDDFVGIGVDTSGAGSDVYYFETTPNGTRYEQANSNTRFRPEWTANAARTADGWNAVMVIPLDVLRIPKTGVQTWRFQFIRSIAARGEHYVWAFNGIMLDAPTGTWPPFTDARFWPAGTGVRIASTRAARPKPRADVYGLESVGRDRDIFEQADQQFLPENVRNVGFDANVPLTSTISADTTLDPDFSNVEIDQETIAPQEFRRQLTEYRPFFSQGAAFINANSGRTAVETGFAPNLVFYSPSIGAFDRGAKVEGSFGDQNFGLMSFRGFDEVTGNTFDDQAFGYEHALQDRSFAYWTDGVLAHHSLAGDDSTIDGGVETRDLNSGTIGYADFASETGSWVPEGHAGSFQGFIDDHRPDVEFDVNYTDLTPNYNPIDGYTANSDIKGPGMFAALFRGSSPGIKSWWAFVTDDRYTDESGAVHEADVDGAVTATFDDGLSLDGVGPQVGELRSYEIPAGNSCGGPIVTTSYYTGYPCYRGGVTHAFDLMAIPIGYGDGTANPDDVDYSYGTFGDDDVHLFTATTTREVGGGKTTLGLEYDGTFERALADGALDSQWLRRVSVGFDLTHTSTLTFEVRSVNGFGGFATTVGTDVAVAFQDHFANGDALFVNYGTPAAATTLDRLIVKYVVHVGPQSGT